MSGLKGGPGVGGFMAEYNEVYGRAKYYDIAFRRDVTREVDFLTELYQRHAGKPLSSMIDIACGPGYHALLFASRGVRTIGLDLRKLRMNSVSTRMKKTPTSEIAVTAPHALRSADASSALCA